MTRLEALANAQALLASPRFTKEDSARVAGYLRFAETATPAPGHLGIEQLYQARARMAAGLPIEEESESLELRAFRGFLSRGAERLSSAELATLRRPDVRDMTSVGGAYPLSGTGYLAPVQFIDRCWSMLKATDDLFSEDAVTIAETARGGPASVPSLNDTTSAAVVVGQGQGSSQAEPTPGQLSFGTCQTWRTGACRVSMELEQDSGIPIDGMLADAFAVRFARGIGAFNVATLKAAATLGATAAGSAGNDGGSGSGANSVGSDDLYSLAGSLDPAFVSSAKCAWVMNWSTLIALAKLKDKQGRPLKLIGSDDSGLLTLMFKPVRICPSMDSIGTGKKPIAFGALDYFIQRRVKGGMWVIRDKESRAEYGQLEFQGYLRSDAGLQVGAATSPPAPTPVVYLQNA